MAKILRIETYDLLRSASQFKYINIENIIEIEELLPNGNDALTRIRMSDGTLLYIQMTVTALQNIINQQ